MGGDADFGRVMHLRGADLHFDILAFRTNYRSVQRLVHIALGSRYIVFETPGDGGVNVVNPAENLIAFALGAGDDAHSQQVVDFVKGPTPRLHLVVDAVEVLGAAGKLGFNAIGVQALFDRDLKFLYIVFALSARHGHTFAQLLVSFGFEELEALVL